MSILKKGSKEMYCEKCNWMGSSFEVVKMEEDGEAYTDDEISTMLSYLEISE